MAESHPITTDPDPREQELLAALRALDARERDRAFRIMAIIAGTVTPRRFH